MGELVLQVWDEDFFTAGTFMGEARVASDVLLHPTEETMKLELTAERGMPLGKITGQVGFKLALRLKPQYPDVLPASTRENVYKPPQLDSMALTTIKDPDMEAKRQAYEGSTFPAIIRRAREETTAYQEAAFERTGRLSELHFGQAVYSYQRSANTVLKVPKSDMLVVPTGFTAQTEPELLSIVARYNSGELPRRDVQFLEDVKSILIKVPPRKSYSPIHLHFPLPTPPPPPPPPPPSPPSLIPHTNTLQHSNTPHHIIYTYVYSPAH